ncbi:RHS repeat-associated core domain-containing protein [Camelimonas lactis]|uniref:RHS repeat-associated protein n=1 Tax=Camelimonas lactis TaxID=659006 RepID=A0A4R2GP99_9HYPH|nr:RHS repeat-associated core domain-containing protein [Camelimonas lactis]TCO11234.1 RHS repeat-associated protein [Camelimonas lactis]
MAANYFSHSDNFVNSVSSNVDPRTGMYTCTVKLGHNSENIFRGPKLPLVIGYAPFQGSNFGLGSGWAFNFSSFDTSSSSGTLTCMNGENYTTQNNQGRYTLNQAKLTSLKLTSTSSQYRVDHGDGTIEILTGPNDPHLLKVPVKIYSPTGAAFSLSWGSSGSAPRITSIRDDSGARVLSVTYSTSSFTLELWPDSEANKVVYTGILQSNQLVSLSATGDDGNGNAQYCTWAFDYDRSLPQGPVIDQVTYPLGMVEKATYTAAGHNYPPGGPSSPLPYVTSFTRTPHGGGPLEKFEYTFTSRNFLGGSGQTVPSGTPYDPAMDNLYPHAKDNPAFTYSSTTNHISGSQTPISTTRTYDAFHRLIREEEKYINSTSKTRATTYYGTMSQGFDNQPNNYQLPKQVTTTYVAPADSTLATGGTRAETTLFSYDTQDGVRTMMQTPDGIRTDYVYYDASGSNATLSDGFTYECPASLSGRKHYIKTITITYPAQDPDGNAFDARTELHEFAWKSIAIPGAGGASGPAPYAVVPSAVRSSTLASDADLNNKTKLRLLTVTYVSTGQDLGRISTVTEQLPDEKGKFQDVARIAMTYNTTDDTFTENLEYTGYLPAAATATASRSFCVRTGQMTQSINELGVINTRAYDWLGRIQTLTTASGGDYAHITSCAYTLAKRGGDSVATLSAIISDNAGRQARVECDGASRVTAAYQGDGTDQSDGWPQVASATYDALGRPSTTTIRDQAGGASSTINGSFAYDAWTINNIREITRGPWSNDDFDPVSLKSIASWNRNTPPARSGRTVTEYDTHQNPAKVTRTTAPGAVEGTSFMQHDGRKRLRVHTDESGNVTQTSYDDWNRPTAFTLADGTSIGVTYDAAFTKALPTAVSINSLQVASRSHDGLGRILTETWGKQESVWTYEGAATRPASHAITGGNTVISTYVNELGQALEKREVKDGALSHDFTYYKNPAPGDQDSDQNPAGLLATATQTDTADPANNSTITRTYDVWGRLISEKITLDGKDLGSPATWTYTALGRPLTYTDPTGRTFSFSYDSYGRLASTKRGTARDGGVSVSYTYDDDSGLVTDWTTSMVGGSAIATETVAYDDFNRETYRTISLTGGDTLTITGGTSTKTAGKKYGKNSLVAQTSVLINDKTVVQTNNYTYDERLRLTKYTCSGEKPPATASGTPISEIGYTYDDYNNITAVTRTAGSADTTTYTYVTEGDDANPFVLAKLNGQDVTSNAAGATTAMAGRTYTYDGFGRLASVRENDATIATYRYDALNRLICEIPAQGDPIYFFYAGNALSLIVESPDGVMSQGRETAWLHAAGGPAVEKGPRGIRVIAADASGTVNGWAPVNTTSFNTIAWDPYGAASPDSLRNAPLIGYNGHYRDAATGLQHLGNGYRPYDPATGRFIAPDNESPFGKGGYNPFAYCDNDPVNYKDPTGRAKWWKVVLWLGVIAVSVALTYGAGSAVLAAGFTAGGAGAALGAATALSFVVWGVSGLLDSIYEPIAHSYDTPDSGSVQDHNAKVLKTSKQVHKWSFMFGLFAATIGKFGGGGGPSSAAPPPSQNLWAVPHVAPAFADSADDPSGRAPGPGHAVKDTSHRQPTPTNEALMGANHHTAVHGPTLLPIELASHDDHNDAFTSDIFPSGSPARQRHWRVDTFHAVPASILGWLAHIAPTPAQPASGTRI